jgi:hypothetical protein
MGFHRGQQGHDQGHDVAGGMSLATFASCFELMDNSQQVAETTRNVNPNSYPNQLPNPIAERKGSCVEDSGC